MKHILIQLYRLNLGMAVIAIVWGGMTGDNMLCVAGGFFAMMAGFCLLTTRKP